MNPSMRRVELLRPDRCSVCKWDLPVGQVAMWDAQRCDVLCLDCAAGPAWELTVAPYQPARRGAGGAGSSRTTGTENSRIA